MKYVKRGLLRDSTPNWSRANWHPKWTVSSILDVPLSLKLIGSDYSCSTSLNTSIRAAHRSFTYITTYLYLVAQLDRQYQILASHSNLMKPSDVRCFANISLNLDPEDFKPYNTLLISRRWPSCSPNISDALMHILEIK